MKVPEIFYNPDIEDFSLYNSILDFLEDHNISYTLNSDNIFGIINLNNEQLQLRYISSRHYAIGSEQLTLSKELYIIPVDYFLKLSKENYNNGIRTILMFDFEIRNNRQFNVLKNYILTATCNIQNRIYGRDCYIKVIEDTKISQEFLNQNCFYGYRNATISLGVYTKKDISNIKKDTLVMVYTFGHNYYGKDKNNSYIEVIRVATKLGCQVLGGASKCIKYFLKNYSTIQFNNKEYPVAKLKFYVDASHNDGKSMQTLEFKFIEWKSPGFINVFQDNVDETYNINGKPYRLSGLRNEVFQRKPYLHKQIKQLISEHKIISVPNAGVSVWEFEI